jgi:hypothetical protein
MFKMKKKRVLIVILFLILLAIAAFGKAVYDDIKSQQRADAVIDGIIENKVEIKDIDYKSLGKYGAFVKEFCEFYRKLDSDVNNVNSELGKYDNYNTLDIKYIKNPEEGKQQIQQYADTFIKTYSSLNDDIANFQNIIEKSPLSSKEKQKIMEDFKAEEGEIADEYKSLPAKMQSVKTKIETLYDFLSSIKGRYDVTQNNVIFNSQKDLDKYKELEKAVLNDSKSINKVK